MMMNIRATYTRLEERKTLIRRGTVFFVNPHEFGARLLWFFGTVEIRNFTYIRQKILRPISLSFRNIFASLISSH